MSMLRCTHPLQPSSDWLLQRVVPDQVAEADAVAAAAAAAAAADFAAVAAAAVAGASDQWEGQTRPVPEHSKLAWPWASSRELLVLHRRLKPGRLLYAEALRCKPVIQTRHLSN